MESLFLHKKAEISEDALTAAIVDLLADLGDLSLVLEVLGRARAVDPLGHIRGYAVLKPHGWRSFQWELWPRLATQGEPDALVRLEGAGDLKAAIVLEVKYRSGKSGEDSLDGDELRDQLGRYARGLTMDFQAADVKLVLYLTASAWPPAAELASSWKAIEGRTHLNPSSTLGWLSWRDIDEVLSSWLKTNPGANGATSRVSRVRQLLEEAGLASFEGWLADHPSRRLSARPPVLSRWIESREAADYWSTRGAPARVGSPPPESSMSAFDGWMKP